MKIISEMSPELDVCIVRVEIESIHSGNVQDFVRELRSLMVQTVRLVIDLSDVHSMCSNAVAAMLDLLRVNARHRGPGVWQVLVAPPAAVKRVLALVAPSTAPIYDFTEHALDDMRLESLAMASEQSRARWGALAIY